MPSTLLLSALFHVVPVTYFHCWEGNNTFVPGSCFFLIYKMFLWTSPYLINYDHLVRWELLSPFKMGKLRLRKEVPILVRLDQV